jgi:hypothetical protein
MKPTPFKYVLFFYLFTSFTYLSKATSYIADGYMDKISYNPTDTARVYINATANFIGKKLYLRNALHVIVDSVTVSLIPQHISLSNTAPWQNGFGYAVSFTYIIPHNLVSGVYHWDNKIYFIVKSAAKNADITIIYPSNTEAAYDSAGGKCLYDDASHQLIRADTISFQRPMTNSNKLYNTNSIIKWVSKLHGYSIQFICDQDLDDYTEIQNSKIICVVGHSEYWTRAARLNFDQFVNNGKHAIVLSGNTMWWQVRYSADKKQLICYKGPNDPTSNPLLRTINWPDPSLHYPPLNSIGVDWVHGAYPPSTLVNYHGWGGYKIMQANSPLLAGTGLHFNDTMSCATREYDGTLLHGTNALGDPILDTTTLGFCKIELIGYDYGEQDQSSPPYTKGHGTFIAFKKNANTGNVINVGGMGWCVNPPTGGYNGGFGGKDSSRIKTITLNMFDLLLANKNIFTHPNDSICLAAGINQITQNQLKIYPNPASTILNVEFLMPSETADIKLFDVLGKEILSTKQREIDVINLSNGVYFIQVKTNQNTYTQKIIVQH